MCLIHKIAWVLVIVGAINWGLVGAFHFNLVNTLFGSWAWVERIVYIIVGLAAIASLFAGSCGPCKQCMAQGDAKKM